MSGEKQPAIAAMSFESALAELEVIVGKLERGDVALGDSISFYERGEALKKRCEGLLRAAEARIEKLTVSADGNATGTERLDPEA